MTDFSLANDFPKRSRDDWLGLVEKTLKGADFDKTLVTSTYDGIGIQPLYTAQDAAPSITPAAASATPWRIAQATSVPDPADANAAILADLEGGATAVVLGIAQAPDAPGIQIWRVPDMERVLRDVRLDAVPVHLRGGSRGPDGAALFCAAAGRTDLAPARITGSLGIDPIGALAATGALPASIADHCRAAREANRTLSAMCAITVSTQPFHLAGCSDAQELAIALASGVAYLRGLEAAGMALGEAARSLRFVLTADADVFSTIARFRAWPALWARVCTACGIEPEHTRCDGETATRMLTRADPWVNMLRATAATFAAATGGAESITVAPFSAALGLPDDFARRIARNTQVILQEESHIARVADAARGSWYVESLTRELADAAWSHFQTIERHGGIVTALEKGVLQSLIEGVRDQRASDVARRKAPITGVSEFPNLAEKTVATQDASGTDHSPTVTGADWSALIEIASRDDAPQLSTPGSEQCEPLTVSRLSELFETLRARSDAWLKTHGARPKVFLARLGTAADFTARSSFAQNFFEAGGIEALTDDNANGALGAAFADSGATLACICSSDRIYAQQATEAARHLKAAGASLVFLAGRPGDLEAELTGAGVDQFIYAGCDLLAILQQVHSEIGPEAQG